MTYFKALFDCVVFDPDHMPLHFFELDSAYHNKPETQINDQLKDSICSAANVKLIRIRAFDLQETSVGAFSKLLCELIEGARMPPNVA